MGDEDVDACHVVRPLCASISRIVCADVAATTPAPSAVQASALTEPEIFTVRLEPVVASVSPMYPRPPLTRPSEAPSHVCAAALVATGMNLTTCRLYSSRSISEASDD